MLPATEVPTTDLDEGSRFEPWRTAAAAICVTAATSGAFWALAAGRRLGPLPTGLLALGTVAGVCWTHLAPCGPGVPPPLANAPGGPWAAITFDDGPSQETGRILDALAAAGARATFFVLGSRARACPEMIRRIVAEGHSLGVHGDRHEPMVFRSGAWLRGAIDGARGAIREAAPAAARYGLVGRHAHRIPHHLEIVEEVVHAAGTSLAVHSTLVPAAAQPPRPRVPC